MQQPYFQIKLAHFIDQSLYTEVLATKDRKKIHKSYCYPIYWAPPLYPPLALDGEGRYVSYLARTLGSSALIS